MSDPVVYLYGDEPYRIDRALAEIEADALGGGDPGLNRELFEAPAAAAAAVRIAAETLPFLAPHRLILVREAHRWTADQWSSLIPYLEAPNPSTCLVFVAAKLVDRRSKAGKLLAKTARLVECSRPREGELTGWVGRMAREAGVRLDPRVTASLVLRVGPDLGLLHQEVEKLRLFAGDAGKVTIEDVEALVGESRATTVFALCDALGVRDLPKALASLRRLLALGEARVKLLYMIARHFRHLYIARDLLDQGAHVSRQAAAKALGAHPFAAQKALDQARAWPSKALAGVTLELLNADLALKSGGGVEVLEALLFEVCGPAAKRRPRLGARRGPL